MPAENYYCPDNFFKKMTDLESPKKNNDCYFYYYSTCAKGDNCTFRHEPSALGCETMCSFWKEGKCLNVHCNFRHMELRKNRKVIPCYWESQPVGCLKAHCPFLHQNPRPSDEVSVEKANISAEKSSNENDSSERKVTAVDSLVVNFEEESDNESMPTYSPLKNGNRIVKVKTLEEIKLEKIQAESAAYYSYSGVDPSLHASTINGDDLRQRIVRRVFSKQLPPQSARTVTVPTYPNEEIKSYKRLSNNELAVILGDESLRKKQKIIHQTNKGDSQITVLNKNKAISLSFSDPQGFKHKKSITPPNREPDILDIKIKTLAEIRAERSAQSGGFSDDHSYRKTVTLGEQDETEVSSTSTEENVHRSLHDKNKNTSNVGTKRKIKLQRKLLLGEENVISSNDKNENDEVITTNEQNIFSKDCEEISSADQNIVQEYSKESVKYSTDTDKMEEDVLLLEDDDDEEYDNVTLKAEDELLNEINSFIDN